MARGGGMDIICTLPLRIAIKAPSCIGWDSHVLVYFTLPVTTFVGLLTETRCRDSSVGIATRYGLGGPGIESRWGGEIFRTRLDWPWGPPTLLYNGYRVFTGGKAAGEWR